MKKLLIIFFIVFVILLIGLIIYLFVSRSKTPKVQQIQISQLTREKFFFPKLLPDGKNILALTERDQAFYKINVETGKKTKLKFPQYPTSIIDVIWSPDGTKAVVNIINDYYILAKNNSSFLDKTVPDGAVTRWLIDFSNQKMSRIQEEIIDLTWNSKSTKIAYIAKNQMDQDLLYVADPSGRNKTRLIQIEQPAESYQLAWSPDEENFIIIPEPTDATGGWILEYNFTQRQMKKLSESILGLSAIWSPDSSKILFEKFEESTNKFAWAIINSDGQNLIDLQISAEPTKAAWFNAEQIILVTREEKKSTDSFYLIDVSKNQKMFLTYDQEKFQLNAQNLIIVPDSKKIFFSSEDRLYQADIGK